MNAEITIDHADAAGRNYLTWAPTRATVRLLDPPGAGTAPVPVTLRNSTTQPPGGQLEFADQRGSPRAVTLKLDLPADGSPVEFWVAGAYGRPSVADRDAAVVVAAADDSVMGFRTVMVRIRKNALALTNGERNRFTTAMAQLNDSGQGPFRAFRDMHRQDSALNQAHGAPGFLSWHRAYLLDLERELQLIDPSVALPYWRFDQAAPALFTADFLGATQVSSTNDGGATVVFGATNLLREWRTDEGPGINRTARFPLTDAFPLVRNEAETLLMGGPDKIFDNGRNSQSVGTILWEIGFDEMEIDPHGRAHTRFWGLLRDTALAPRDPLFFLLHCNVDRLWALWQHTYDRFDLTKPEVYFFRGSAGSDPSTDPGHNLQDTMWPWNGITSDSDPTRPPTAPRVPFPRVPTAAAPPFPRESTDPRPVNAPTVADMIDYQGYVNPRFDLNFAYDDVRYGVKVGDVT